MMAFKINYLFIIGELVEFEAAGLDKNPYSPFRQIKSALVKQ